MNFQVHHNAAEVVHGHTFHFEDVQAALQHRLVTLGTDDGSLARLFFSGNISGVSSDFFKKTGTLAAARPTPTATLSQATANG